MNAHTLEQPADSSSADTYRYLLSHYGPLLTLKHLAEVLHSTPNGVQPGVGDSFDVYSGLADGNADLFKSDSSGPTDSGDDPDIYMGVSGNPDLQF